VLPVDLRLRRRERLGGRSNGIVSLRNRTKLAPRLVPSFEQLGKRLRSIAAFQIGEALELALEPLEPSRLRVERGEERPEL